jgi:protein-disulfide isomerase
MAKKRVEAGRGRKPGVVRSAKKPGANRAFYMTIGVIAVLGIAALTYVSTRPKTGTTINPYDSTLPRVASQGYVMGSPSAPIEVVEFGDFECPQCGRFATLTEPDIRTRLVDSGRVRFRFIDYPLDMHRNTWNASRAAACADEQGKFWEMHDAIFANQDRWNTEATDNPDKVLKEIGKSIVPNADQFDKCVDTKKTQAKIQAHWELATARHLPGTPTFLIGDQQLPQFLGYDDFKKLVDDAIAKGGPKDAAPLGDTSKAASLKKGE